MDETPRGLGDAERLAGRGDESVESYADRESRRTGEGPYGTEDPGDRAGRSGTDSSAPPDQRMREIRAEIEQTREDMSETIDAIQDKLRPGNIVAGATERARQATTEKVKAMANTAGRTAEGMMTQTREAAGELTRSARQNPIPAALIGVGTAWLLMNLSQSRQRSWGESERVGGTYDYGVYGDYAEYSDYPRYGDQIGTGWLERLRSHPVPAALAGIGLAWLAFADGGHRASWRESDAVARRRRSYGRSDAGGAYDTAATGASDAADRVARAGQELASRTQEYVGDSAEAVRRGTRRAQNQLQRLMHENPLLVGAAALVVGAAVGLALPETERENEWMGEARDSMVEKAQDMARTAASRVQEAAGDVAGEVASRVVTGKDD